MYLSSWTYAGILGAMGYAPQNDIVTFIYCMLGEGLLNKDSGEAELLKVAFDLLCLCFARVCENDKERSRPSVSASVSGE